MSACSAPCNFVWRIKEHKVSDNDPILPEFCYYYELTPKPPYDFLFGLKPYKSEKQFRKLDDSDLDDLCEMAGEASAPQARDLKDDDSPYFAQLNELPADSVIGDFNGDGNPDLAVAIEDKSEVAILLGGGGEPMRFATGQSPVAIALGLVNNDPFLDLVTANEGELGSGDLSLLLGNGDGTFQAPAAIGSSGRPQDVAMGDFDGDGLLDLAVAILNEPAVIRLGNGDGTFQDPEKLGTSPARSLQVVDLNPEVDQHDDIVTDEAIFRGNGDGSFADQIELNPGISEEVFIEEIDGDGHLDILLISKANFLLSIFRGNGDGTVMPASYYVTDNFPEELITLDFDGNGHLDIFVSSTQAPPVLLLGNGDGSFQGVAAYPTTADLSRRLGADGVAVADFTGDGIPDMAVANGGNIQCSVANPCFGGDTAVLLPGIGDGRFGGAIELPEQPGSRVVAGDWNGDLLQDLAFTGVGQLNPQLFILFGNGDGTFAAGATLDLPGQRLDGLDSFITTAQVDAGDTQDLLVANFRSDSVSVFTGDGKGSFTARPTVPAGQRINGIAAGDFNRDGKLDMAIASLGVLGELDGALTFALGNGDGTFQAPQTLRQGVAAGSVAAADFDRDGKLDLAVTLQVGQSAWDVEILLGNDEGSFDAPLPLGMDETQLGSLCVADADGDGNPDLAVTAGSTTVIGLRGLGDGSFARALQGSRGGGGVLCADLDLDGRPDILSPTRSGFVAVRINALDEFGLATPQINITQSGGSIELDWPAAFPDYELIESPTLQNWQASDRTVDLDEDIFRVTIENAVGKEFFRLAQSP